MVFAALLPCFADLPALRQALGFAGHALNKFMCSFCDTSKKDINNLDMKSWKPRTSENHIRWAHASRNAPTSKARAKIFKEQGIRYSVLTKLPYWKPVNFQCIDAMHNLLLGLLKWQCTQFWGISEKAINPNDQTVQVPEEEGRELERKQADHKAAEEAARVDKLDTNLPSDNANHVPFLAHTFRSHTSPDDFDFDVAEGRG
jgi:hypothetical protein